MIEIEKEEDEHRAGKLKAENRTKAGDARRKKRFGERKGCKRCPDETKTNRPQKRKVRPREERT